MYETVLFEHKTLTMFFGVLLVIVACALAGKNTGWWRPLAFGYTPALACSFYLVTFFVSDKVNTTDIIGLFLLELSILCIYCQLIWRAYNVLHTIPRIDIDKVIKQLFIIQIILSIPILASSNFGIFSEGSRIAFLGGNFLTKYILYCGILLSLVQSGLIARRVSIYGSLGGICFAVLIFTIAYSILSGSKAGFFLWILSVMSLVDYRRAGIKRLTALGYALGLVISLLITATVVGEFLGLTVMEFFEIAANRIFLVNDARALALDLRNYNFGTMDLAQESFRGLFSLFGAPSPNPPIGNLLYEQYFTFSSDNGANASLSALLTYFTLPGETLLAACIAIAGALLLYVLYLSTYTATRNPFSKYFTIMIAIANFTLFSQDFLAFQIVLPISMLIIIFIFLKYETAFT